MGHAECNQIKTMVQVNCTKASVHVDDRNSIACGIALMTVEDSIIRENSQAHSRYSLATVMRTVNPTPAFLLDPSSRYTKLLVFLCGDDGHIDIALPPYHTHSSSVGL